MLLQVPFAFSYFDPPNEPVENLSLSQSYRPFVRLFIPVSNPLGRHNLPFDHRLLGLTMTQSKFVLNGTN